MRDIKSPPLIRWGHALQGLLGGGIAVAGVVNPFGLPLQAALLFGGVLTVLDSFLPDGEAAVGTACVGTVAGAFFSMLAALTGFGLAWTLILIAAAAVWHIQRFRKQKAFLRD